MTKGINLLHCPHCGSTDIFAGACSWIMGGGKTEAVGFRVKCEKCGAQTETKDSLNDAVIAWDLRFRPKWVEQIDGVMYEPIKNPDDIILYDEMANITILVHDEDDYFEEKVFAKHLLRWQKDEFAAKEYGEEFMSITLGSISRQLTAIGVKGSIIVIYESGLDGTVYRYGNHGEYWEIIGKLAGWA